MPEQRRYPSRGINKRLPCLRLEFIERLKLLGRSTFVDLNDSVLISRLAPASYRARIERGVLISVEAFDWNCPQHITRRFTVEEIGDALPAFAEAERTLRFGEE